MDQRSPDTHRRPLLEPRLGRSIARDLGKSFLIFKTPLTAGGGVLSF